MRAEESPDRESLRRAVGQEVRARRDAAGLRQEDIARAARRLGLKWSSSRVAALERGDKAIPAEELVLLPVVLVRAGCEIESLADLIPGGGQMIQLGSDTAVAASLLRTSVAGRLSADSIAPLGPEFDTPESRSVKPLDPEAMQAGVEAFALFAARATAFGFDFSMAELREVEAEARQDAEQTAARRFKIHARDLAVVARATWRRSLTAEREDRLAQRMADGQAERAVRGHVTRELYQELQPGVERWIATEVDS